MTDKSDVSGAGGASGGERARAEGAGGPADETRPLPPAVEDAIRGVAQSDAPAAAALTLAAIANRAIAELNKLARAEANRQRGQPDWGTWAGLANSARDAVLKTATCRKAAGELAQRARGGSA